MTAYECKSECLFQLCREKGIWNMAIGDLGNEMGMGAIKAHLARYVPYMEEEGCICGCKAESMAATAADNIMTATVSEWAGYALIAATAFINADAELLIDAELEREVIAEASRSGMVDMYGWLEHAIDGIPMEFHINLVNMMKNCVENVLRHENKCDLWFQKVNEKGFLISMNEIVYKPAGDSGVLIQFGDRIDEDINRKVSSLCRTLEEHRIKGVMDMIPSYTSLLVVYDGSVTSYRKVLKKIQRLESGLTEDNGVKKRIVHRIPVCYDEAFAPDLKDVAAYAGLSQEEVIRLHCEREYLIYMLGFLRALCIWVAWIRE